MRRRHSRSEGVVARAASPSSAFASWLAALWLPAGRLPIRSGFRPRSARSRPGAPLPGDAAAQLTAALGQLASGYSFGSTVSVGGQVATQANGRWIGGGSEFTVTTNGVSITYRTLPPRSWVLQSGAGWVEVNGSVPSGNPLDALRAPGLATVVAQTGDMLELTASYPAALLGLAGSNSVAVDLILPSDGSLKATYAAATGDATSSTTITPDPSQDPIVVPSPS